MDDQQTNGEAQQVEEDAPSAKEVNVRRTEAAAY